MSFENISIILALCYLIGSIPTAYIIGRLKGINIFEIGSGNMGAGNTARALGIQWGLVVYVLDGVKGLAAVFVAREIGMSSQGQAMIIGAIAVVLGHNWSIFATMMTGAVRGGKGAATASGTWLLLVPPLLFAAGLVIWAVVVYITRYVSLAVLTTVGLISLFIVSMAIFETREPIYVAYLVVTFMVFYRHRENIRAIINGTERRFGERAKLN